MPTNIRHLAGRSTADENKLVLKKGDLVLRLLLVSDAPKASSGLEESSKTVGNPMIEPVRLPALRVHGGRAWSVQRSDAMANGRFDEKGPLVGDVRASC